MRMKQVLSLAFIFLVIASTLSVSFGKTVVFYDAGFPSVDNGAISPATLVNALRELNPVFVGLEELPEALSDCNLLVLPYGSAFPADDWSALSNYLNHGNVLIIGGRPFYVPVLKSGSEWLVSQPQNTYSREIGIYFSYEAEQYPHCYLKWADEAPFFRADSLIPERVFVNAGYGGRYRGLGFLMDGEGNRVAAPVVADDFVGYAIVPHRRVYLSFQVDSNYWDSDSGVELIREAAVYASLGGVRIWLDINELAVDPGGHVSGAVDVLRGGSPAKLTLELLSGKKILQSRVTECGNVLHEEMGLTHRLTKPGLYLVRSSLSIGDTVFERYVSGVEVRDTVLLHSGNQLTVGKNYFRLGGKPYLMVGANYFSTDQYTSGFFVGGSLGGNAWVWERDFAEMERLGFTAVRTGIWLNRLLYLDQVSGAASERLLRYLEAYLMAAARHHMQVIFTFFAFDPQVVMQQGTGQEGNRLGPGSNPYVDSVARAAEIAYVQSIVFRFRHLPCLSYDLINEPSFSNPSRLWKGNSPNGDPAELHAWRNWLREKYGSLDSLAKAWRMPPSQLGSFERIPLPNVEDLEQTRYGNSLTVRAVDYNLFAQAAFGEWAKAITDAIRQAGSEQLVTVGQDEGGVTDRILNQFTATLPITYTVNHTWWRDDALLWNSIVAKSPLKPNLIEETAPQPVWSMDGDWRLDDQYGLSLEERKLVLSFANANAGVLHWDWTNSDDYGLMRRDGSQKVWMHVLRRIADFAKKAEPYAHGVQLPPIALVIPQSLQLSVFNSWSIEAQQKAVRALYNYARGYAFAIGEYQLDEMPSAKLIIVPAPWILSEKAWINLMSRVKAGAAMLISGRVDADEHWWSRMERVRDWNVGYECNALKTRYVDIVWPGDSATLTYSGNKTTFAERGVLKGGETFVDILYGNGHIFYFAVPLELSDQVSVIGKVYKFAMNRAGVSPTFATKCIDPGISICPTSFPDATLYVMTSETAALEDIPLFDEMSGRNFNFELRSGHAILVLIDRDGRIQAQYGGR